MPLDQPPLQDLLHVDEHAVDVEAEPPRLLVVAGRHRLIPLRHRLADRARRRELTRPRRDPGRLPGPHGALHRLAVIGTGGHVAVTRRLLAQVAGRAQEQA